jgi:HlyD family secretion protein
MKHLTLILIVYLIPLLIACKGNDHEYDATGTFEADEVIISSEIPGKLIVFDIEEGAKVKAGQMIGYIDTLQLHLTRKQLQGKKKVILSKRPDITSQLIAYREQLKAAQIEYERVTNLLKADAAFQKQLDDIEAEIAVIKGKIAATQSSLEISTASLNNEIEPIEAQIDQINDQINKAVLTCPMEGTVLLKYVEQYEMVGASFPLYKIADLSSITLRAFITGDQLSRVRLNQKISVYTDDGEGKFDKTDGEIYWISDKAEFTPKTIQTKNERANKVYAIKVRVENPEGNYKIGMYGEINLDGREDE